MPSLASVLMDVVRLLVFAPRPTAFPDGHLREIPEAGCRRIAVEQGADQPMAYRPDSAGGPSVTTAPRDTRSSRWASTERAAAPCRRGSVEA